MTLTTSAMAEKAAAPTFNVRPWKNFILKHIFFFIWTLLAPCNNSWSFHHENKKLLTSYSCRLRRKNTKLLTSYSWWLHHKNKKLFTSYSFWLHHEKEKFLTSYLVGFTIRIRSFLPATVGGFTMRRRSLSRTSGMKATRDSGRDSPTSFRHLR